MRLDIQHQTSFDYAVAPSYGLLQLRMTPQSSPGQSVFAWDIALEGARAQSRFFDQFGNIVELIELLPGSDRVSIQVSGSLETLSETGVIGRHNQAMPLWFYTRQTALTEVTAPLKQLSARTKIDPDDALAGLHALSQSILDRVTYTTGETDVTTRATDALARGKGVCQDHAHIFLSIVREQGFPARYVSGYLLTRPPPGQAKLVGADAMHAWVDVWCGAQLGWVGFDPTNNCLAREDHIAIGMGRDYADVSPIDGTFLGSAPQSMSSAVDVERID